MLIGTLLEQSNWSRSLAPDQLARVKAEMQTIELGEGDFLCRKGDEADMWFGVARGLLKMHSVGSSGKSVAFTGLTAGSWFGEGTLLKQEPRRYDIIALRASTIAAMPRTTFSWLLDTSIAFNRFLLLQLNERLGQFIAAVEYERLLDTDARVARSLAALFHPSLYPNLEFRLALSQEEIGQLAGISRQRANHALQVLQQAGLIALDYGEITILDLDGLRRFGA